MSYPIAMAAFVANRPATTPIIAQAFGVSVAQANTALRRAMRKGLVECSVRGGRRPRGKGLRTGPTPTLWSAA